MWPESWARAEHRKPELGLWAGADLPEGGRSGWSRAQIAVATSSHPDLFTLPAKGSRRAGPGIFRGWSLAAENAVGDCVSTNPRQKAYSGGAVQNHSGPKNRKGHASRQGRPPKREAERELAPPGDPARVDGLNPRDPGLLLLAEQVRELAGEELLLAYSGAWPGVQSAATKLILDVRERAIDALPSAPFAELEAQGRRFGSALLWPRAHLGKDFSGLSMAQAGLLLREGGQLLLASRKQKGAKSLAAMLCDLFGQSHSIVARDRGYAVYRVTKGPGFDAELAQSWIDTRYRIEDPRWPGLELHSAPGVFSRKAIDEGTAALLGYVEQELEAGSLSAPRSVIDLCCGIGTMGIWAAQRFPEAQILAVDSNLRAVALAQENAQRAGVAGRFLLRASDGLPDEHNLPRPWRPWRKKVRLALINPPTHSDQAGLRRLFRPLRDWMGPQARVLLVASRPGGVQGALEDAGARVRVWVGERYSILEARFESSPAPDEGLDLL